MGSRPSSPSLPILTLRKSAIEHISVGERSDAHTFASHLREDTGPPDVPLSVPEMATSPTRVEEARPLSLVALTGIFRTSLIVLLFFREP